MNLEKFSDDLESLCLKHGVIFDRSKLTIKQIGLESGEIPMSSHAYHLSDGMHQVARIHSFVDNQYEVSFDFKFNDLTISEKSRFEKIL